MGSVLSYLTTTTTTINIVNENGAGAGAGAANNNNMTLLELLDDLEERLENPRNEDNNNNNVTTIINWDVIYQRLISHPEEAAAYCHTVETSPLVRCLLLSKNTSSTNGTSMIKIPVRIIRAFLNAYEDAAWDSDQYGTTPLLAAIQRTAMPIMMMSSPVTSTTSDHDNVDDDDTTVIINDHNEINDFRSISAQVEEEKTLKIEARDIINMILQINTSAASYPNKKGLLPLHYVRSDYITAERLVKVYASAIFVQDNEYERTPLHNYCCLWRPTTTEDEDNREAIEGAVEAQPTNHQSLDRLPLPDPQIARLLIIEAEKIASTSTNTTSNCNNPVLIKDKKGLTPLDILYQELKTTLEMIQDQQKQQQQQLLPPSSSSTLDRNVTLLKTIRDRLWEILIIFIHSIVVAAANNKRKTTTFQMVHALVSLHCPAIVMKEALRRYPQQTIERDHHGRTPLLISVDLLDNNNTNNNDKNSDNNNNSSSSSKSTQNVDEQERAAAVCCELIKCNPTAARMTDEDGRVAIDLLSEKGFYNEELFEAFVKAEPRAIDTRDLKNRHYPFLTAALAPNNKSNVASVYHLLRAKPHVIQFFLHDHK